MAHDRRKQSFGIIAGKRVGIGVADTSGGDFEQYLAWFRCADFDFFDDQRFAGLPGDGCARFHRPS